MESQDLLRRLIREKDERARQFVENAQRFGLSQNIKDFNIDNFKLLYFRRRKTENLNEWRSSEESRRLAVETALVTIL